MKILINELQYRFILNESYKITFKDKQEIDKEIRSLYMDYLEKYKEYKENLNNSLIVLNYFIENSVEERAINDFKKRYEYELSSIRYMESKKNPGNPKLYNEFYVENYDSVLNDYADRMKRNSTSNFKQSENKKLDDAKIEEYFNSLTKDEINKIKLFLDNVSIRQLSGTGESISKKKVRDSFFNTPVGFQRMYSVKPSKWYWRGDDNHPCDVNYEQSEYEFYMQSFSIYKSMAEIFGSIAYPSTRIGSYGGSFSIPFFLDNMPKNFNVDLGDDEGEIIFFDVKYKCKKKFNTRI